MPNRNLPELRSGYPNFVRVFPARRGITVRHSYVPARRGITVRAGPAVAHVNREINAVIRKLNPIFNGKFTSHSFRRGYITYLWQNIDDVEFVRQVIGHSKIETTVRYIKNVSEEDKADKLATVD